MMRISWMGNVAVALVVILILLAAQNVSYTSAAPINQSNRFIKKSVSDGGGPSANYGFELSIVSPDEVIIGKRVYDVSVVLKNTNQSSQQFSGKIFLKGYLEANPLYLPRISP